jgi:hypothetical protein
MTILYLAGHPLEEHPSTIAFDYNESEYNHYCQIDMSTDDLIAVTDFHNNEVETCPAKLLHAILEAARHKWFNPNNESLNLMKDLLSQ